MIIRVGNFLFKPGTLPVMIQFTEEDLENIRNMAEDANSYCAFPQGMPTELIQEWMSTEEEHLHHVDGQMLLQMERSLLN